MFPVWNDLNLLKITKQFYFPMQSTSLRPARDGPCCTSSQNALYLQVEEHVKVRDADMLVLHFPSHVFDGMD